MVESAFDKDAVKRYRAAATELHELSTRVEQQIDSAFENGNNQAAHDALVELKASGVELEKLRATLTPTDLFIAKYNIEVHGAHEVSFVLPERVSRYEMLCEAQGVVTERDLVWPTQLKQWASDQKFTVPTLAPERIQIDGHVDGGDGKTRARQEAFLTRKKLPLANLEDLAAAFVAHYVATGEDLFEDKAVRAAGGALYFFGRGLCVDGIVDRSGYSGVAVSARVPRNSKN
jgi:hypothetical protein